MSPRELHHLFLKLLVVSDALHRPRLNALRKSVQHLGTTTTASSTHLLSGIKCRSDVRQCDVLELPLCTFYLLSCWLATERPAEVDAGTNWDPPIPLRNLLGPYRAILA